MSEKQEPDHTGHRRRIKEKYRNSVLDGWLDYEVLEMALSYAIGRKDTKPIAKKLIKRFKTVAGVLDADRRELEAVKGISEHTSLFLKFLRDISILYLEGGLHEKDLLSTPGAVFDYLRASMKGCPNEEIKVLFLDSGNRLLSMETLQSDTVNRTAVFPRKIAERGLYHGSTGVIIAHNHPAGTLEPSKDDCKMTKEVRDALNAVDIRLLDHVLVTEKGYFSFSEKGLL